jgi:hypothetical protein
LTASKQLPNRTDIIQSIHDTHKKVRPRHDTRQVSSHKKVKVKVEFSLEQAVKAQRGSRGIAVLFL